jgi:hypothetical protein
MRKSTVAIGVLAASLIGSNAWWAYHALDSGVTLMYADASLQEHHEALAQALAILPVAASPDADPNQVLMAAQRAARYPDSFEKDGFTWVGRLGLRFNESGRLIEAVPSWSPFE